jgi:hypothetical protein
LLSARAACQRQDFVQHALAILELHLVQVVRIAGQRPALDDEICAALT